MITTVNLITRGMLLLLYSCQSPASSPLTNIQTPAMNPGSFTAQVNHSVTTHADTAFYRLAQTTGAVVSTPNGGMFQLELPDGTRMTLNAATRVSFIDNKQKTVQLSLQGELFVQTMSEGCKVEVRDAIVTVPPGTTMNIKAYEEDSRVEISPGSKRAQVLVNQQNYDVPVNHQASLRAGKISLQPAQSELIHGWRNGYFTESVPLDLLKAIARWYNVKLELEGPVPTIELEGQLPRSADLKNILTILRANSIPVTLDIEKGIIKVASQ